MTRVEEMTFATSVLGIRSLPDAKSWNYSRNSPLFVLYFQLLKESPNKLPTIFEQLEIQYKQRRFSWKKIGSYRRIIHLLTCGLCSSRKKEPQEKATESDDDDLPETHCLFSWYFPLQGLRFQVPRLRRFWAQFWWNIRRPNVLYRAWLKSVP